MKKVIKELKKELTMISIRLSKKDLDKMKEKSEAYTLGNLSKWIIYASKMYNPSSKELTKISSVKKK